MLPLLLSRYRCAERMCNRHGRRSWAQESKYHHTIHLSSFPRSQPFLLYPKNHPKLGTSELFFSSIPNKSPENFRSQIDDFVLCNSFPIKQISTSKNPKILTFPHKELGVPSIRAGHRVWPRGLPYLPLETDRIQSFSSSTRYCNIVTHVTLSAKPSRPSRLVSSFQIFPFLEYIFLERLALCRGTTRAAV